MCIVKSPKAFVLSTGIQNLPITWYSVDNFDDRVLCCKPTSINHNIHGCFLCRYCATGWFWWISGLRAVAMWSSSSFTKIGHLDQHDSWESGSFHSVPAWENWMLTHHSNWCPRILSYYCDMTLLQEFQPMGAQLSLKAVLPLAERLATVSDHCNKTGPCSASPVVCCYAVCEHMHPCIESFFMIMSWI